MIMRDVCEDQIGVMNLTFLVISVECFTYVIAPFLNEVI